MPGTGRSLLSFLRLVMSGFAVLVVCTVVPAAASALGMGMGSPAAGPSAAISSADPDFAGGERRDRARRERLASEDARAQRTRSQTAHHGLNRDAALALAREMIPEQLTGRLF